MRKNLGVIKGYTDVVPIRVYDSGELWQYQGTMRAEIEGDINTTTLTWVQLTGEPITYVGPTNGLTISFTTTDLINKTFRCYTNKGTEGERWDDGVYYHNPVDISILKPNMVTTTVGMTNIFDPDSVYITVVGGIANGGIGSSIEIARFSQPVDQYTRITIYGIPDYSIDHIVNTVVSYYDSVLLEWVELVSYEGLEKTIYGLPHTADNYRVISTYSRFGIIYELTWYRDDINIIGASPGATDVVVPNMQTAVDITAYEYALQTINKVTMVDDVTLESDLTEVQLTSYQATLQTIWYVDIIDTVTMPPVEHTTSLYQYTFVLQSNTVVG